MKEEWKMMDFEFCLDKTKTTTKLQSSKYGEQGAFPIVSQEKELISGYWDNEDDVFKHETPIVIFGDHTQVVKYIDFDFVIGADGVKILAPKSFLNPKYFYYWVMSIHIPSHGYARHYRYLKEHQVPVPPLSEQERIVSLLDAEFAKIDTLKVNAERNLQNAKDLFQAALKKELEPKEGWKRMKLEDVCVFIGGYTPQKNEIKQRGVFPYFKVSDMNRPENQLYMSKTDNYVDVAKKTFPKGSIVFPKNGGAIFTEKKRILAQNSIVDLNTEAVFAKTEIMSMEFLFKWLNSIQISKFDNGGGLPSLNISKMKQSSVPVPPLSEQPSIVSHLDEINSDCIALQANYEKTIALCDDLKQALLRKAFNGEI